MSHHVVPRLALGLLAIGLAAVAPGDRGRSESRPGQAPVAVAMAAPSAPIRAEIRANVFTRSSQMLPGLDAWPDGTQLAVWASRRQESGTFGVFGRLLDPAGAPVEGEIHINQTVAGQQTAPAVGTGPGTGAWVVWSSSGGPASERSIMGRRFERAGTTFRAAGDEFRVSQSAVMPDARATIAHTGDRILVAWAADEARESVATVRIFDRAGAAITDEFALDPGSGDRTTLPAAAPTGAAGFVVAWAAASPDGTPRGIRARRLGPRGEAAGSIITVAGGANGEAIEPSVAADARGGFVVAWMQSGRPDAAGYGVRARRFDDRGRPAGAPLIVAEPDQRWRSGATVAVAPGGGFVVAYTEEEAADRRSSDVFARRFAAGGEADGPAFRVHRSGPGRQSVPTASGARRLIHGDDGRLSIAWTGATTGDGSGVGVTRRGPAEERSLGSAAGLRVDSSILTSAGSANGRSARRELVAPVRDVAWQPPAPDPLMLSQGPDTGFIGFATTGWDPADPDVAAGPDHLVVVVNQSIRFYTHDGTLTLDQGLSGPGGFWEELGAGDFVFDPVVLFDRFSGRFILAATERLAANSSLLCVAVSDDDDPNGAWNRYRYDLSHVGGNIDFPNLGVGPNAVYITTDFFDPPRGNWTHILPKQAMLDGDPAPLRSLRNHTDVRGHASVKTYDQEAAAQYFATPYVSNSSIQLVAVTNPLGTPMREVFNLPVPTFTDPPDADQRGTTNRADTIDRRFKHGVLRHGHLWLAHAIGVGATARTRWYEIAMNDWPRGGVPSLVQVGTQNLGPRQHNWHAAIDVDAQGTMVIVFNRSSPDDFISVDRAWRRAEDPPGTLRPPKRLQISQSPELGDRWGDYSGVEEDPERPSVFWSHTMFRTAGWRTWVGRIELAVACPADVDGTGEVGFQDLVSVLANWGPCSGCPEDLDGDGDVAFADLVAVLSAWGPCPE